MFEHIERIWTDLDNPLCNNLRKSIEVIENAVRIFDTNQLAISFNGGKDATVVLHLVRYVFFKLNILDTLGTTAPIIYFDDPKTFPEMTEFLIEIKSQYNLQYTTYDCSFKDGVMDMTGKRGVKAIFMGVREGDPHAAGAEHMHPSSRSWPAFMRVYPILTWTHSDVWTFLKACHVPYCTLYDRGYTSIGLTHNTIPHPALR
ncbi:FLAD1, partial [Symbiodinium microadriaticum]